MTDQEYEELVEKGFELWSHITEVMNNIIIEDGTIDINDTRIWNANLHKWNNEHWYCALAAVEYVYEQVLICLTIYAPKILLNLNIIDPWDHSSMLCLLYLDNRP